MAVNDAALKVPWAAALYSHDHRWIRGQRRRPQDERGRGRAYYDHRRVGRYEVDVYDGRGRGGDGYGRGRGRDGIKIGKG